MKLADTTTSCLTESRFFTFLESGEAPTWSFGYDNYKHDQKPDILLLGAFTHPHTGNNLVGGINLNYLNQGQRDDLARVLPKIMQTGNLYSRYHLGKRLLPMVFDNFYRTYDAKHIRGVTPGVFYPKYGFSQSVRRALAGLFKSKAQRQQDAQPQFPHDLAGMQDQLDKAVSQLQQQDTQRQLQGLPEPETPEMQAARRNFRQFQIDKIRQQQIDPDMAQLQQANQQMQATQLQQGNISPQAVDPEAIHQAEITPPPENQLTPDEMRQQIERDRQENQEELLDPNNDIDLGESIMYYSPIAGHYIIESI